MIGKVITNKSIKAESFVACLFEKLGFTNLVDDELITKPRIFIPDFVFKYEETKYCIEVRAFFSASILGKIIEEFYQLLKQTKFCGIFVILDKVPIQYKTLVKEKYNIDIYDISNILYIIYGDKDLQQELNNIIDFSLDGITPQETNIKANTNKVYSTAKEKNINYIEKLSNIKEGRRDAKKYEKLLEEIIKDIFSDELMLFQSQYRTEDGINIFDMICKIKNGVNDDFFSIIEKFYKTKYILFEFKNYQAPIKQGEICTTEKYLFEAALRKVAIIISRHGIDENGKKLAEGILRESGKLIIVLNDTDLKRMIELYIKGDKPTIVFTEKLDEILTRLEK